MSAYGKNTDRYFHRQYLRLECLCAHIPNHVATGHMKILHRHLQARKKQQKYRDMKMEKLHVSNHEDPAQKELISSWQ